MEEQALNRSSSNRNGYKGVHCFKDRNLKNPYQAQIWLDGKMRHLGMYETAEAAHKAYLNAVQTCRPSSPFFVLGTVPLPFLLAALFLRSVALASDLDSLDQAALGK